MALLNPPGSVFDEARGMLSSHRSVAQERDVNFLVDGEPLFASDAYPYRISILELALRAAHWREAILSDDAEIRREVRPRGTAWTVDVRRDADAVVISSNYQTTRSLRCSTADFVAGVERFLDAIVARLFIHAPLTLSWRALHPLKRYLALRLGAPIAQPRALDTFRWNPNEVDWELVWKRRALNPPGSEYDNDYGESATELFGAPLTIMAKGAVINPTAGLRTARIWAGVRNARRGQPREIGMLEELRPGEPWPLLDLALQLATYLRPSRTRGLAESEADDATRPARSRREPRTSVLDPSLILLLEQEMGASGLKVAAKEFIRDFVRVVYARGDDATAWHVFRPLRELAL